MWPMSLATEDASDAFTGRGVGAVRAHSTWTNIVLIVFNPGMS